MQIIICEDELLYQKSIDSKIEQWMQASEYVNVKKTFFHLLRISLNSGKKA